MYWLEIYVQEGGGIIFPLSWVLQDDLGEMSTRPWSNMREQVDHNVQTYFFYIIIDKNGIELLLQNLSNQISLPTDMDMSMYI